MPHILFKEDVIVDLFECSLIHYPDETRDHHLLILVVYSKFCTHLDNKIPHQALGTLRRD